jgi:lysophospholipase L1-like esterase
MIRRRSFLLGAPLLLAAAGPAPRQGVVTLPGPIAAATPLSRMDLPWWRARHGAVLDRLRDGPVDLLLIGDSITQDLERRGPLPQQEFGPVWDRFYAPRKAANLGFKGDTTASVLWRLRNGEVAGIAPKVAQVLIGANNFGRVRWNAAQTLAGIEAILTELHKRLPRTKIILLSVLPSKRSAWVDAQTTEVNHLLATRHHPGGGDVRFVDVTPVFMKNGALDQDAFYDGALTPPDPLLHPSAAAWMRMAEMVEPTLAAMMGDRPR